MDLGKDNIRKLFIKYLIPALCASVVTSFYYVADTMMIGHGVGEEGLIALNIVLPVFSPLYGIGYLFGIGGSVLMSVAKGRRDEEGANRIFSTSLILMLAVGILVTVLLYGFRYEFCYFLGADEDNIALVMEYAKHLFFWAWSFAMFPFMLTFVRNDKNPKLAMLGSVTGSLTNVVLDYVFIFMWNMGLAGAIVATVVGNALNILITCSHFLTKKNTMRFTIKGFAPKQIVPICVSGATSFLNELASGFVILIFNWQILRYIGDTGIVVYSTITNTVLVTIAMCNGVGTAMQPIVSYNFGAGKRERIFSCKKMALWTSAIMNAVLYVFIYLLAEQLIHLYVKPTEEVVLMGVPAVRIYFLCVFPMLVNIFYATYFQSVVRGSWSFVISILRGFVCSVAMVLVLPMLFGGTGIWWATPVAETLTLIVTLYLARRDINLK